MVSSPLVPKARVPIPNRHVTSTVSSVLEFRVLQSDPTTTFVVFRKGGPFAVNDANLVLGRLIPSFFPKIFGQSRSEPRDLDASFAAFEKGREQIKNTRGEDSKELHVDREECGFVQAANNTMCRPISSASSFIDATRCSPRVASRSLIEEQLLEQGFISDRINFRRMLNTQLDGTDTSLMVLQEKTADGGERIEGFEAFEGDVKGDEEGGFEEAFKKRYQAEFGFLPENKNIIVDDVDLRGIGKTFDTLGESIWDEMDSLQTRDVPFSSSSSNSETQKHTMTNSIYFDKLNGRVDAPLYRLQDLNVGDKLSGPAAIIDATHYRVRSEE